jgi:hypothetical protein
MTNKTNANPKIDLKEKQGFSVRCETTDLPPSSGMDINMAFRGFRITFANGYTMSVQFGTANYCEDYSKPVPKYSRDRKEFLAEVCPNAEIAIISPDGNFVDFKDGQGVRGHTDPDTFAKIVAWVAGLNSTVKEAEV